MLTKESEEKLSRVAELMQQREAIDAELNDLLDSAPTGKLPPIAAARRYHKKPRKSGVGGLIRICKMCGEPGHMKKTCKREGRGVTLPKNFGVVEVGETLDEEADATEPITEQQFEDIKTSKDHGMNSRAVASEMRLLPREVNLAWQALSYGDYLDDRG